MPNYDYTPEQLRQMQQEAAERVREMQRRARARLEGGQPVRETRTAPESRSRSSTGEIPYLSPPVPPPPSQSQPQTQPPVNGLSGLLGQLGLQNGSGDSDRTMLMMLLMLLSSQGNCSPGLIAALFWLMMG